MNNLRYVPAMTMDAFLACLAATEPPPNLSPPLLALWRDAAGDWDGAHKCVDELSDPDSMWAHAYLHRKEGDQWNADYWYERAGKSRHPGSLDAEWREIAAALIARGAT